MRGILWKAVLLTVLALGPVATISAQQVIVGVRTGGVGVYYVPSYSRYWREYATYPYGYVPYRVGVYVGPRYDPYWGEPYYGYYPYVYPRYVYVVPAVPPPPSRAEYSVVPRVAPPPSSNGQLAPPRPLTEAAQPAEIVVIVPSEDAQVRVEDYDVRTGGSRRVLLSPPLLPGKSYEYTITASWKSNGAEVRQTRKVIVQAGGQVIVDFTKPAPEEN